jgi:hypothetical protein
MYDLEGLAYGMKTRTRGSLFLSRISGRLLDYLQKPLAAVVEDTVLFSGKSKWNETCGLIPQRQAVAPASEGCYDQVREFFDIELRPRGHFEYSDQG